MQQSLISREILRVALVLLIFVSPPLFLGLAEREVENVQEIISSKNKTSLTLPTIPKKSHFKSSNSPLSRELICRQFADKNRVNFCNKGYRKRRRKKKEKVMFQYSTVLLSWQIGSETRAKWQCIFDEKFYLRQFWGNFFLFSLCSPFLFSFSFCRLFINKSFFVGEQALNIANSPLFFSSEFFVQLRQASRPPWTHRVFRHEAINLGSHAELRTFFEVLLPVPMILNSTTPYSASKNCPFFSLSLPFFAGRSQNRTQSKRQMRAMMHAKTSKFRSNLTLRIHITDT